MAAPVVMRKHYAERGGKGWMSRSNFEYLRVRASPVGSGGRQKMRYLLLRQEP